MPFGVKGSRETQHILCAAGIQAAVNCSSIPQRLVACTINGPPPGHSANVLCDEQLQHAARQLTSAQRVGPRAHRPAERRADGRGDVAAGARDVGMTLAAVARRRVPWRA